MGTALWAVLMLFACRAAAAETAPPTDVNTFQAEIVTAQARATACEHAAGACDPSGLPDHQQIGQATTRSFQVSWEWFHDDLSYAKNAAAADRARRMQAAERHLAAWATEAGSPQTLPTATLRQAREAASAALARPEFRAVTEGPSWTQRQLARLQDWFLRLFTGMDRLGRRAPWLAPLIEWGCFTLAVAGLLYFVRQSLARQALRISLGETAALAAREGRDSTEWARMAEERAAAADWREAVHCLYWAAIALMEGRRAWKPNATRTPREYLRLLQPGSQAERALRDLTRTFERLWYGHAVADEAHYRSARDHYQALEVARPERAAPRDRAEATATPLAGGA